MWYPARQFLNSKKSRMTRDTISTTQQLPTMTALDKARALIADDMRAVDQLIGRRLSSDVALINQLGGYIVNSGGKRLRPQLVLLAAGALGYQGKKHQDRKSVV